MSKKQQQTNKQKQKKKTKQQTKKKKNNKKKKRLDLDDLDLIFKVTPALWMSTIDQKACLHSVSWTKWWILAKLYVLYHWDN